jgi:hypothetical protein
MVGYFTNMYFTMPTPSILTFLALSTGRTAPQSATAYPARLETKNTFYTTITSNIAYRPPGWLAMLAARAALLQPPRCGVGYLKSNHPRLKKKKKKKGSK